ncbi:MAG: hypothetical protein Q7S09_04045 [bacterium]|nr:hypothetical protein [bacterium]
MKEEFSPWAKHLPEELREELERTAGAGLPDESSGKKKRSDKMPQTLQEAVDRHNAETPEKLKEVMGLWIESRKLELPPVGVLPYFVVDKLVDKTVKRAKQLGITHVSKESPRSLEFRAFSQGEKQDDAAVYFILDSKEGRSLISKYWDDWGWNRNRQAGAK